MKTYADGALTSQEAAGLGTSYVIAEFTKSYQLVAEGRRMHHCVASYIGKCVSGQSSIWSLRCEKDGKWESLVTIEVNPQTNTLVQARCFRNRAPLPEDWKKIEAWARLNYIKW